MAGLVKSMTAGRMVYSHSQAGPSAQEADWTSGVILGWAGLAGSARCESLGSAFWLLDGGGAPPS